MLTIVLKDLRTFTNTRKYLIIQFVILTILILILFVATLEFYAQGTDTNRSVKLIDVGKKTYTIFIIAIFFAQFVVPRHAVDAVRLELTGTHLKDSLQRNDSNWTLLRLTPLGNWRIIGGKLISVVLWSFCMIWFTIPLFALSGFLGGIPILQYLQCGIVIFVSCLLYALIGIGLALWQSPLNAKGISYGIVLTITFGPLLPLSPFTEIPVLEIISPLVALFSVLLSNGGPLWLWNVGFYSVLCLIIFLVLVWRIYRIEV